ncbi:hypothetical protein G7047_14145 [Diaphorobacter sp. HDW4A]|nr:hypothetical protein [Diaphorobacter sp. HDW4A]QIL80913.1 hypothetical protein G7047_14145 [Diaphorobacter sp. HDW4A]
MSHWLQCLALTRVVGDALSNIVKHSRARHVRVTVDVSGLLHDLTPW